MCAAHSAKEAKYFDSNASTKVLLAAARWHTEACKPKKTAFPGDWRWVRERIARAAERVHRDASEILLLAVTEVFPAGVIREAYALGLRDF